MDLGAVYQKPDEVVGESSYPEESVLPRRVYQNPWGKEADISVIVNQEKSKIWTKVLNSDDPASLETELKSLQAFCIQHEGPSANTVFSRVLADIVLVATHDAHINLDKARLVQILKSIDLCLLTDFSKERIQSYLDKVYPDIGPLFLQSTK